LFKGVKTNKLIILFDFTSLNPQSNKGTVNLMLAIIRRGKIKKRLGLPTLKFVARFAQQNQMKV